MVDSAVNVFLETLRDLLVEETKFLLSVSGDVEKIKRDLGIMHALLMKADRESLDSPTLNDCVAQLKDLAFKAENVLETYAVEVASKKEGQSLKEKLQRYIYILCECCSAHQLGKEARSIMFSFTDLTDKLQSELGQESSSRSSHQEDLWRQTYAHEVEHHFVGMEKDIEILISMVKNETRVVKIYGMGGLGKTTLARKIYNHSEVQSYARAWVCITQQFQLKAVLGRILKQLAEEAQINDGMDITDLVDGIHRVLEQRKCLIVIDDIWENDDWEIIKQAFPINCNVLLTTRNKNIANQECHPYKLECLTEDEGWDLLQKIALPQDYARVETGFKSLENIGRQIVLKCGGLPLSISVIGGILRQKEGSLAEWKKVNMKMDSYLRYGEGVKGYKRVKEVLDLSYDALPYYLKPCFLYLASFPEDADIERERLYLLWMAEGFISYQDKGPDETLRDVAERYLSELAMRCMVQVHKNRWAKIYSCRLHDLIHELCSSKVEKEKLLKRVDAYKNGIPSSIGRLAIPSSSIGNSISRLVITLDGDKQSIEGLEELKDLRSFMLLAKSGYSTQKINFEDSTINFDRSQYLRILVLGNCEFDGKKLPSKVGKLIHLRYLSLRGSIVSELPQFVCSMPYLQTLDLRVVGSIRLPNVIWKMKRLRHLFLSKKIEVIGGEKLRLDGLDELETLDMISSKTACVVDIPKLISLRTLTVEVHDMDSLSAVVQHMSNNKSRSSCETRLWVQHMGDFSSDVLKNVLMSPSLVRLHASRCNISGGFPYYNQGMCENLVELDIIDCKVGGDVMEELGKYPMLQYLCLHGDEVLRAETLICRSNSFPQLKYLGLQELPNLKKWEVEERAMPKLTRLFIYNCSNLEVPDGLRSALPPMRGILEDDFRSAFPLMTATLIKSIIRDLMDRAREGAALFLRV